MMTRTVLLTGATGFVGRQVLAALAASSVRVRVVVRERAAAGLMATDAIESVVTTPDLFAEPTEWWSNVSYGIDTVVHVAWYAEPGKYLQSSLNMDCLEGTLRLARGCSEAGVRRFVGVGTCFEYDLDQGDLAVNTPLRPTTIYASAKAAAFLALSQWLPQRGIEFAWCRLFYLFGDGEDERRLVPYLHSRLASGQPAELTSGSQIRDFLDVEQAGRMIAATALGSSQGAVNVCSGQPVTVRQLAERIADQYGRRDLLRFNARPDNLVDPPRVVGIREVR